MYFTKHVLILTFVRSFSFFQFLIFTSFVSMNILRIFACEITRDQAFHTHIFFSSVFRFFRLKQPFLEDFWIRQPKTLSEAFLVQNAILIHEIFGQFFLTFLIFSSKYVSSGIFIALVNIFNTRKILSFCIPPQHLLYDLTSSTIPLLLKFLPTTIALRGHYRFSNNIIIQQHNYSFAGYVSRYSCT